MGVAEVYILALRTDRHRGYLELVNSRSTLILKNRCLLLAQVEDEIIQRAEYLIFNDQVW